MCGIFGYFSKIGTKPNHSVINAMGMLLEHRGPDDRGVFFSDTVALGNQRLSIIDIEKGHQPFISDDEQIVVVQNGEIYNYKELAQSLSSLGHPCKTSSDTEVILRAYESYGIDFLKNLNGMFSIAIYDKRIEKIFLIRDRIGIKPLYYFDDGKDVYFSSEIKSILKAGIPKQLNYQALDHFLTFNYVAPPLTFFNNIHQVMPGHFLEIDVKNTLDRQWWSVATAETLTRSEDEWVDDINHLISDSVRLRMRCDVPFGAFLSGGIDSSTVLGHMVQYTTEKVKTFCIGFKDKRFDESVFAEQASQRFASEHYLNTVDSELINLWTTAVYHCDQPHGDVSFLPTYEVSRLAASKVKMVLTGDGGDELFAGYDKYFNMQGNDNYLGMLSLFSAEDKAALYHPSLSAKINLNHAEQFIEAHLSPISHFDEVNKALYLDVKMLLPGNNLVKPDRMGMAHSLEARTPFLDHRLVELAFSIPGKLKLKDGETKYILKRAVEDLIGNDLCYRKKQMFTVPIGEWFKKQLSGLAKEALLSPRSRSRGLFNMNYIEKMLIDHLSGQGNYTRQLRALIALELWFRAFIDLDDLRIHQLSELGLSCEEPALI